jgi:soluble lytic murein transglycosylase-like protein
MFLFQVQKSAQEMVSAGKATELVATYTSIATGKEYHRHIFQRADGKVFDPMMNPNPATESAWTSQERWKARLGLDLEKYEFSFGGKAEEKTVKQKEQNAFMKEASAPQAKKIPKPAAKKAKQTPLTYDQYLDELKNRPVFGGDENFSVEWEAFMKKAREKAYGGKSTIDIAYEQGKKYNVDPKLVLAYVFVESRGRADASSKENEPGTKVQKPDDEQSWGLMQIIPKNFGLSVDEAKNPYVNMGKGTKYIAGNLKEYPGKAPIQILGYNRGTAGAGNFESNGYIILNKEKATKRANEYVSNVLQAYELLAESKFDDHKNEPARTFLNSEDYKDAMAKCEQKRKGGYLADFDFGQGFAYPAQ